MLNLAVDITPLASGVRTGIGEYTYELLDALFHIDSENQYFLFYNTFKDVSACIPKWENKNVHFVHTRWPNKFFHVFIQLFGWPKIDALIEKKTGVKLDYFFSPNIGFQSLRPSCKHILTVHDLSFEIFPECFSPKMRLWHSFLSPRHQCTRADIIFTPSENTKRDIVDLYKINANKIKVLVPGLTNAFLDPKNISVFSIQQKYRLPEKYILFLGTVEPRKNIESLLQAFEEFGTDSQEYHLVIAGASGWKNTHLMKNIEKMQRVQYIGYIDPEDKPALYAGASLFVYPSLYEGFGFPVLEAMALGVPVITSNRSSLPEVAGDAVYFINPYNISEIVEGMKVLLREQSTSQFFIQKGKEQIKQFCWKKTAEQFLASL